MVFALANLSLQMLERLVPPELTPRSAFYSRDDNTHNMTCNRIMKLTRELNKTNYFPPLAQVWQLQAEQELLLDSWSFWLTVHLLQPFCLGS